MAVELDPHQIKALGELRNGSVLKGGVGTGKSRTALAYYFLRVCGGQVKINGQGNFAPFKTPRDLYIITTAMKRDKLEWEQEAANFALSRVRESSFGGVQVVVDSWNNITNYVDVKDAFFIFDEQRLVGSGAWVKSFLKIAKVNKWIVLSATPGDTWLDYIPIFVANGFYKNRTEFLRAHVVYNNFAKFPKVDHYVNTGVLQKYRKQILVEMPLHRHTVRHILNIPVEYDQELYEIATKRRWHPYENRPIRQVSELFAVWRKIVNTDPSRFEAVKKLSKKHQRLIIFYNFDYELEILRTLGEALDIPLAEWNGHKHQPIPDTDRWVYLVQYTAGAEGWNCVSTDAMIFYTLNYSWRITEQGRGRIDRMNTPFVNLYYYVLRSSAPIDLAIIKSLATKKNFNEKDHIPADWKE